MREKILNYIREWERRCYSDGIPDSAPLELENRCLVPSYRLIVKAILKNDASLKILGFTQKKSELYSELKRLEIMSRKGSVTQLKLF